MRLQHYNLENAIDFEESAVWTLVCESPRLFARLTRDFCNSSANPDDGWLLYDVKQLTISKYLLCLVDYFDIGVNDRKSTNILQEQLKQVAFDEEHTFETHKVMSELTRYLYGLAESIDFPTRVGDVDLQAILKCVGISFLDESENLCERLMDYVTLISRLTLIKVVVCVNLRSYLETEQLECFFKHCQQNAVYLLCVESHYKQKLDCEKILCSDEDMCEFFPN